MNTDTEAAPWERAALSRALVQQHELFRRSLADIAGRCGIDHPLSIQDDWEAFERHLLGHLEVEDQRLISLYATAYPEDARALRREHETIRDDLLELSLALELGQLSESAVRDFAGRLEAHCAREARSLYAWLGAEAPGEAWNALGWLLSHYRPLAGARA